MVPCVSAVSCGGGSIPANPAAQRLASRIGRNTSTAFRTFSIADLVVDHARLSRRTACAGFAERLIIFPAAVNRLFEDSRIAGNPAQAILFDQSLQLSAEDQIAPDVVEPDRLFMSSQLQ
jgi:hypothetical protein